MVISLPSTMMEPGNNGLAILSKNSVLVSYSVLALTELAGEATLSGVILKEVCEHLRTGKVVDSYYFITFSLEHLTECEATNTAKTVNCYFCHCFRVY